MKLLETWISEEEGSHKARVVHEIAERAKVSFNEKFWYAEGGYLFDVIDGETGNDSACRPNQVLAISLENPVLDLARWQSVLEVV